MLDRPVGRSGMTSDDRAGCFGRMMIGLLGFAAVVAAAVAALVQ